MREASLEVLRCPECRGALALAERVGGAAGSVGEGLLRCACGQAFPIIDGAARLLPAARASRLRAAHPAFFIAHREWAPSLNGPASPAPRRTPRRSLAGSALETAGGIIGRGGVSLDGARVLDIGCGDGALARHLAALGAHVCALSENDEAVRLTALEAPEAEVVEVDFRHPPVREGAFDVVVSAGELPWAARPVDRVGAFLGALRPGGFLFTWWLGREDAGSLAQKSATAARVAAKALPVSLLKAATTALAPAFAALQRGPRGLSPSSLRATRNALEELATAPLEHRFTHEAASRWLACLGLDEAVVEPLAGGFALYGRKPIPEARAAVQADAHLPALLAAAEADAPKPAGRRGLAVLN